MNVAVGALESQAKHVSTQQTQAYPVAEGSRTKAPGKAEEGQAASFAQGASGTQAAYALKKAGLQDAAMPEGTSSASRDMDIVLAHTLSGKDYQKAREEGFDPSEITAEESVTIIDHIKASLLKSGKEVAGVTDDLSREQLSEITGSEAYAGQLMRAFSDNDIPLTRDNVSSVQKAMERAGALTPLTEETLYYMVENEIPATTDQLYLASHAAKGRGAQGSFFAEEGGYVAKTAQGEDLSALQGQIDDIIRKSGMDPADEEIQREAKGLIDAQVTLTPEHLRKAHTLRNLTLPPETETVIRAGARAIAAGRDAVQGDLTNTKSLPEEAVQIDNEMRALTDEDIKSALEQKEEAPLTLRDLADAHSKASSATAPSEPAAAQTQVPETDSRFLQARLQLEEVRLSMSAATNLSLLRRGFAIDTAPMEQLIDALKEAMGKSGNVMFHGEASVRSEITVTDGTSSWRLYTETNLKVTYLREEMPLGVIGAMRDAFRTDTLDDIFSRAQTWKVADSAYEAMQTEVRRDLGDSIKKAFDSAPSLLKDLGLSDSADNLRAVRILAYNRMEVTADNVRDVRALDAKLDAVLNELKPAAVLDMIRDGKNPLSMTLDELAADLRERTDTLPAADEKYARFLYKLDRAGEISEAERTSYIGIYRMFETLQKTDHAAIGTLLETGGQMTIRNLLTATRTLRAAQGGVRLTADDGADGYKITNDSNAIDRQIETAFSYYSAKADIAFAHLAPEKLQTLSNPEEMPLPDFSEQMESLPEDAEADADYDTEALMRLREAVRNQNITSGTDIAEALSDGQLPVTAANMEAMRMLRASGSLKTKQTLWEDEALDREDTETLLEALDGEEEYGEVYRRTTEHMQSAIEEQMLSDNVSYVDHRALALTHRTLSVAAQSASQGSFDIPVEAAGRTISMHVTLAADNTTGSSVQVTLDTEEYGTLSARMEVVRGEVKGLLATSFSDTPQTKRYLEDVRTRLSGEIAQSVPDVAVQSEGLALLYQAAPPAAAPSTERHISAQRTLLQLAKAFAKAV